MSEIEINELLDTQPRKVGLTKVDFEFLIKSDYLKIKMQCVSFLGVIDDLEDVIQTIFEKAFLAKDDFKWRATPSTWLYRIATNYLIDLVRKKNRERDRVFFNEEVYLGVGLDDAFAEIGNTTFISGELLDLEKIEESLFGENSPFSDFQRNVLVLAIEGSSTEEISEFLDCSLGSVCGGLFAARRKAEVLLETMGIINV